MRKPLMTLVGYQRFFVFEGTPSRCPGHIRVSAPRTTHNISFPSESGQFGHNCALGGLLKRTNPMSGGSRMEIGNLVVIN